MTNLTQFRGKSERYIYRLQKLTIHLSFKISRICEHVANFKTHLPRGRHKCMVPYETPSEIIALKILQNIEFKHSTY